MIKPGIRSVISSIRRIGARADTLASIPPARREGSGAQTVLEYVALRARSGASACSESRFWQRVSNEAGRARGRRIPRHESPSQNGHHEPHRYYPTRIHIPSSKTKQKTRPKQADPDCRQIKTRLHRRVSLSKLVPRAGLEPA